MTRFSFYLQRLTGMVGVKGKWLPALLVASLVAACGGGGGNLPVTGVESRDLTEFLGRRNPTDLLGRQAINYSPFRTANRDTESVTKANIEQDLRLLERAGFGLIRIFSSDDMVGRQTLEVIHDTGLDLKVQLGIWIGTDEVANQAEIARGIALANDKTFSSIVAAVSVGNEAMVSWSGHRITVARMLGYIRQVRGAVPQPVTSDDNWAFYAGIDGSDPRSIVDAIDYVALHTYPIIDTKYDGIALWDWRRSDAPETVRAQAMMDSALAKARKDHDAVRAYLRKVGHPGMPVVIGETGWKAVIADGEKFRAHPVNQKMYLDRLLAWAAEGAPSAPDKIFWFQAFDEPWKQSDDKWGLFDVNRKARYALQNKFPQDEWTTESDDEWTSNRFADSDAVFHKPFNVGPAVTAARYSVYSDLPVQGEARPAQNVLPVAWASGSAVPTVSADAPEGANVLRITPGPADWGWGFALSLSSDDLTAEDLSSIAAQGFLNLSIKTLYPGVIELGYRTGSDGDESAYLSLIRLDPAANAYGYQNNGQWHHLRIPLSALVGERAFGMFISALDLKKVMQPFVIADRYEKTGKTAGFAGNTATIDLDAIFWSR